MGHLVGVGSSVAGGGGGGLLLLVRGGHVDGGALVGVRGLDLLGLLLRLVRLLGSDVLVDGGSGLRGRVGGLGGLLVVVL